jgi:SAM-dependent methyltransferase
MSSLALSLEDFVFIDYGSGKGRALLLASEFPFKKVIGLEFSPELHRIAERNIQNWTSPRQRCKFVSSICIDFLDFVIPEDPAVLFFFDPCSEKMFSRVLEKIGICLQDRRSELCLVYVAPSRKVHLLESALFLEKVFRDPQRDFCVYRGKIEVAEMPGSA